MRACYGPTRIELEDRACAAIGVSVKANGRIAGRIVDADGRPVSKAWVSALPDWFTNRKEFAQASVPGGNGCSGAVRDRAAAAWYLSRWRERHARAQA